MFTLLKCRADASYSLYWHVTGGLLSAVLSVLVFQMCEEKPQSQSSRSPLFSPRASRGIGTAIVSTQQIKLAQVEHKPFSRILSAPPQPKRNAGNKWKGSMLPLFPDSQHQMRAQGSVIKENIPDEKLSAAFWKFLIKRTLFAHPPQPLTWFLTVMLFFAPSSLLAVIWHKEIAGKQLIQPWLPVWRGMASLRASA